MKIKWNVELKIVVKPGLTEFSRMGRNRFTRDFLEVIPEFDPTGPNSPHICRVTEIRGKAIVQVMLPDGSTTTLATLPPKFRGVLWVRRGALVIATEIPMEARQNEDGKVTMQVEHLLTAGDVKEFTKQGHIPECFQRQQQVYSSSEDEDETTDSDASASSESESEYSE